MSDILLSPHFPLSELVRSYTAQRLHIDNSPPPHIVDALRPLCVRILEPIHEALGPVKTLSGYRCEKLNQAVGGASRSQHMKGQAVDIEVPGVSNIALGKWIEHNLIEWDQLIYEFTSTEDPTAGWIHVSFISLAHYNRRQVLTYNRRQVLTLPNTSRGKP